MANQTKGSANSAGWSAPGAGGPLGDLREEIHLLRETIRRVGQRVDGGEEMETAELLKIMEGLARAAVRLAALIKTQRAFDEQSGATDVLSRALDEAIRELGIG